MDYGINRVIDPDLTLGKILTIAQNYDKVEQELIDTINEEFNHNVAQQLYVSHQAWNLIKVVKEEQISLIVNCYNKLEKNSREIINIF